MMYLSEDQVRAYLAGINCPTCVVMADHGWPYDASTAAQRQAIVQAATSRAQGWFEDGSWMPASPAQASQWQVEALEAGTAATSAVVEGGLDVWGDIDAAAGAAADQTTDDGSAQPAAAQQRLHAYDISPLTVSQITATAERDAGTASSPEAVFDMWSRQDGEVPVEVAARRPPFPPSAGAGTQVASAARVSDLPAAHKPGWYWGVTLKEAGHHPHLEPTSAAAVRSVLEDFLKASKPLAQAQLAQQAPEAKV